MKRFFAVLVSIAWLLFNFPHYNQAIKDVAGTCKQNTGIANSSQSLTTRHFLLINAPAHQLSLYYKLQQSAYFNTINFNSSKECIYPVYFSCMNADQPILSPNGSSSKNKQLITAGYADKVVYLYHLQDGSVKNLISINLKEEKAEIFI